MIYRGGVGQWSWALHRFTGVGVLLFLFAHILDTFLVVLGPAHYNAIIQLYRHPLFRVSEIFLFASVLFHSLNGVRITLLDFRPGLMRYHRQFFYAELALFAVAMVPVTYLMAKPLFLKLTCPRRTRAPGPPAGRSSSPGCLCGSPASCCCSWRWDIW